jgi:hypothetical protein
MAADKEEPDPPVLLETGDLSYETGVSGTWIRELVRRGVIKPMFLTPRGGRLFDVSTVNAVHHWRAAMKARRAARKKATP